MTSMPFQISTPCPPWCDHHSENSAGESDHFSAPVRTRLGTFGIQVSYSEPTEAGGTIVYGGDDDMTAGEARQLATVPLKLADTAEGLELGR